MPVSSSWLVFSGVAHPRLFFVFELLINPDSRAVVIPEFSGVLGMRAKIAPKYVTILREMRNPTFLNYF